MFTLLLCALAVVLQIIDIRRDHANELADVRSDMRSRDYIETGIAALRRASNEVTHHSLTTHSLTVHTLTVHVETTHSVKVHVLTTHTLTVHILTTHSITRLTNDSG
jgi:hypothetical protein